MKSLSEMCRRLPSAEAMLVLLLLGWGWRREEGTLAPAWAPARPSNRRLLLLPALRQPASIIVCGLCENMGGRRVGIMSAPSKKGGVVSSEVMEVCGKRWEDSIEKARQQPKAQPPAAQGTGASSPRVDKVPVACVLVRVECRGRAEDEMMWMMANMLHRSACRGLFSHALVSTGTRKHCQYKASLHVHKSLITQFPMLPTNHGTQAPPPAVGPSYSLPPSSFPLPLPPLLAASKRNSSAQEKPAKSR